MSYIVREKGQMRMMKFKCVGREIKGNQVIEGYRLIDTDNNSYYLKSDELKAGIRSGSIEVINLRMLSNGTLRVTDSKDIKDTDSLDGGAMFWDRINRLSAKLGIRFDYADINKDTSCGVEHYTSSDKFNFGDKKYSLHIMRLNNRFKIRLIGDNDILAECNGSTSNIDVEITRLLNKINNREKSNNPSNAIGKIIVKYRDRAIKTFKDNNKPVDAIMYIDNLIDLLEMYHSSRSIGVYLSKYINSLYRDKIDEVVSANLKLSSKLVKMGRKAITNSDYMLIMACLNSNDTKSLEMLDIDTIDQAVDILRIRINI